MADLVQENVAKAQKQQKAWYDKRGRLRQCLCSTANKLFAQWQCPYQLVKRMGKYLTWSICTTGERGGEFFMKTSLRSLGLGSQSSQVSGWSLN